jgi:alpha-galactosidase
MTKLAFIGAGSAVFARRLLTDVLSYPELAEVTVALHDIDAERLRTGELAARRVAEALSAHPTIVATTDRRAALDGADYVICMIQVGGYQPATVIDFEIPKRYGLRQTIADTLGIGGIMRALRTIPVLLGITRDMEALCPGGLLLNYVNPMAMNCWALSRATPIQTVGLCHSVYNTASELAADLGVPVDELNYQVAGINHLAFYLKLEHQGQDVYPRLREIAAQGRFSATNQVRYDAFKRFGYFVTESSEHFSEYVPWYIKRDRPELVERLNIPLDEYLRRCEDLIGRWDSLRLELETGTQPLAVRRSTEYAAQIVHSRETGQPRVVYGNVTNTGLIENLPRGCCVEVPCLVDRQGLQPIHIGSLPPQLAALMLTNINVQSLAVEAALTGRRDHIYHAALLDPHTAAELDPDQIYQLVDDLVAAHGDWLPAFH